jgi:hypothetical protein
MPNQVDDAMALYKAGKYKEALAIIEAERLKAKYSPDTAISEDGKPPRFTKRGKQVECGEDGIWRPKLQAGKLIQMLKLVPEDADISEVFIMPAGTLTITAGEAIKQCEEQRPGIVVRANNSNGGLVFGPDVMRYRVIPKDGKGGTLLSNS